MLLVTVRPMERAFRRRARYWFALAANVARTPVARQAPGHSEIVVNGIRLWLERDKDIGRSGEGVAQLF